MRDIYQTDDTPRALELLAKYGVDYVVVGQRERSAYGPGGLGKFAQLGVPVFGAGGDLTIYELTAGGGG